MTELRTILDEDAELCDRARPLSAVIAELGRRIQEHRVFTLTVAGRR
jgi:hypothetical protein